MSSLCICICRIKFRTILQSIYNFTIPELRLTTLHMPALAESDKIIFNYLFVDERHLPIRNVDLPPSARATAVRGPEVFEDRLCHAHSGEDVFRIKN
jgi:hypothetical protein